MSCFNDDSNRRQQPSRAPCCFNDSATVASAARHCAQKTYLQLSQALLLLLLLLLLRVRRSVAPAQAERTRNVGGLAERPSSVEAALRRALWWTIGAKRTNEGSSSGAAGEEEGSTV